MSEINSRVIEESLQNQHEKKSRNWIKWTSIAIGVTFVVLVIGVWQGGWFGNKGLLSYSDENTINFEKTNLLVRPSSLDLNLNVTIRDLTDGETRALFGDLPINAHALFSASDNRCVGIEGKIGNVSIFISMPELLLPDYLIHGKEEVSELNGVPIKAGYFMTDPNSRAERNAIYYASFELGDKTVYVENWWLEAEGDTLKNNLVEVIGDIIANGEIDLSQIQD